MLAGRLFFFLTLFIYAFAFEMAHPITSKWLWLSLLAVPLAFIVSNSHSYQ